MKQNRIVSLIVVLSILSSQHAQAANTSMIVSSKTCLSGVLAVLGCVLLRGNNIPSYCFGGAALTGSYFNYFGTTHLKELKAWYESQEKKN